MTDLRKLLDIVNDNTKPQSHIELHDSFDLELDEETILETGVVGLSDSAILLEMDEKGCELLESKGIKFKIPDYNDPEVRQFYDIPTIKRVQQGLSEPTDITDYETPPSMRDPTRGKPGWVKRKHRLQQMGALPKDDNLTEEMIKNVCEAHVPISTLMNEKGLKILFDGMSSLWGRFNFSKPKNDEEFLNFADKYILLFLARDIVAELQARNLNSSQIVELLEKESVLVRIRDQVVTKLIPLWHDYHWKDNPLEEGDVVSGPWMYSGETINIRDLFKLFIRSKFYKGPIADADNVYSTINDVKDFLKEIRKRMPKFKLNSDHTDDQIALAIAMHLYQQSTDKDPYNLKESAHKKVYKMHGEPIGEIGKNSDGEYYVKHYLSGIDNTGYESKSEAVKDLKAMQHSVTDKINEGSIDNYKKFGSKENAPKKLPPNKYTSAEGVPTYAVVDVKTGKHIGTFRYGSGFKPSAPGYTAGPHAPNGAKVDYTQVVSEAKYRGRTVPLGKKMKGDVKKSKVYVRKPNGNIVKVEFGDPNMRIKKSNPKRRKSFRARHRCDNPGPRWKARYWSCRSW